MTLILVQGDTAPDLSAILHAKGNVTQVLNLTNCSVRFQMRKEDDRRFTINNTADVISAPAGTVRYQWGPNDLAVPGDYQIQWEVTYPDAKVQTTEATEVLTVRRQ